MLLNVNCLQVHKMNLINEVSENFLSVKAATVLKLNLGQ